MGSLPLQRSLNKARGEGYSVGIVERFIPFPKPWGHRVDLFGLFDAVAVRRDIPGVLGIQACRDADIAAHRDKAIAIHELEIWKAAGNRAVIWGWAFKVPRNPDGSRRRLHDGTNDSRKVWTVREIVL